MRSPSAIALPHHNKLLCANVGARPPIYPESRQMKAQGEKLHLEQLRRRRVSSMQNCVPVLKRDLVMQTHIQTQTISVRGGTSPKIGLDALALRRVAAVLA